MDSSREGGSGKEFLGGGGGRVLEKASLLEFLD